MLFIALLATVAFGSTTCICPDGNLTPYATWDGIPCAFAEWMFNTVSTTATNVTPADVCKTGQTEGGKFCCGTAADPKMSVPALPAGSGIPIVTVYDTAGCKGNRIVAYQKQDVMGPVNSCEVRDTTKSYKMTVTGNCANYKYEEFDSKDCTGAATFTLTPQEATCKDVTDELAEELVKNYPDLKKLEGMDAVKVYGTIEVVANIPECGNEVGGKSVDDVSKESTASAKTKNGVALDKNGADAASSGFALVATFAYVLALFKF